MKERYYNSIEEALQDFKKGKIVIVCDDEERENEGDLVFAASKATPEKVNFLARYARGIICLALTEKHAEKLALFPQTNKNTALHDTAFTVSIDAYKDVTTGVSAFDRCETILKAVNPDAKPDDFARPGHVFPVVAHKDGVFGRRGHTEAAVDLARLAGLIPAGVICEILAENGQTAKKIELVAFKEKFGLKMIRVSDIVDFRRRNETVINKSVTIDLPTAYGHFRLVHFSGIDRKDHVALIKGEKFRVESPLVRIHSECLTGDVFGSLRCDCGEQMRKSLEMIENDGNGILIYLRQEGRGIGLLNKLLAYKLQEEGFDTVEANIKLGFPPDLREYWVAAKILKNLGVRSIRLLTNNPQKVRDIEKYDITVEKVYSIFGTVHSYNYHYLKIKKEKLNHNLMGLIGV